MPYCSVRPLFQPGPARPVPPVPFEKFPRERDPANPSRELGSLHVLAGDKNTGTISTKIGVAWNLQASNHSYLDHPGAPMAMIRKAAQSVAAQFVILDMHPDLSPLNCMLQMSSDYFLCPLEACTQTFRTPPDCTHAR